MKFIILTITLLISISCVGIDDESKEIDDLIKSSKLDNDIIKNLNSKSIEDILKSKDDDLLKGIPSTEDLLKCINDSLSKGKNLD